MNGQIRLKIKKYLKKLLLILAFIAAMYFVMRILSAIFFSDSNTKELTIEEKRIEKKNSAIFNGSISDKDKDIFSDYIRMFYTYCNKKEYDKAYEMISQECKVKLFPTIEDFKKDIDIKFDKLKAYDYQNLSNVDNIYVYQFFLFDDVIAYGANTIPEKRIYYLGIIKESEKDIKITLNGYLKSENVDYKYNINGVKFNITHKDIYYDHVDYTINTQNSTSNNMVFRYDNANLILNGNGRKYSFNNKSHTLSYLFVNAGAEKNIKLSFDKSFDTTKVKENMIRIENVYMIDYSIFNKLLNSEISINQLDDLNCVSNSIELGL